MKLRRMHWAQIRIGLGSLLLSMGLIVTVGAFAQRHTMPKVVFAYKTTETKEVPAQAPAPKDHAIYGPTRVQSHTRWSTNDLPTGDYQFLDDSNHMFTITFCNPVPDMADGTKVTFEVHWDSNKGCGQLLGADIIKDK